MTETIAFLKYLCVVILDGDYLNDWLTWLPDKVADAAYVIGKWLAPLFM